MEIQFSKQAAQDACDALRTNSTEIEKNRRSIIYANADIKRVWSGAFADIFHENVEKYADWLVNVKAYVDYIDKHIETCKKNYGITEITNERVLKGIEDMFL